MGTNHRARRWLRYLFWDSHSRRLRALWRMAIFLLARWLGQMALGRLAARLGLYRWSAAATAVSVRALVTVGVALCCAVWLDKRGLREEGLLPKRSDWSDLWQGLLLGAGLMTAIFVASLACGWAHVTALWAGYDGLGSLLLPVAIWLLVGVEEEVYVRGYLLPNLAEGLHGRHIRAQGALLLAWLLTSAYFGALHANNPAATWRSTLALMMAGLFLGLPVVLSGRLGMAIGLHIAWNLFEGTVYGFPVSGYRVAPFSIWRTAVSGPPLWTGGAFGPEAGLLGWLAMIAGSLMTLYWAQRRHGSLRLAVGLAGPGPREAS